ncbi:molybdopterin-dependent oxidoreductase [Acidocella sp.]|uniref:molybdopterin-dependent oxidoreductase n=1 Tax=Acidocella sp. TaxID=50710 RepID=UPI002609CD7D|nr:molybdopterin-dependent oxidoreductase [Acidocella sp.]
MVETFPTSYSRGRRHFVGSAAALGAVMMSSVRAARAENMITLPFPEGPRSRPLTTAFPNKGEMILQRIRPPLLETPFEVFDQGILTPNDQFFVRWHLASIPQQIDVTTFRLMVGGHVNRPLSLSLSEVLELPRVELVAVNQCSGNSRGFFQPRVPGGEWGNGAMGNARWTGFRLRDLLDRAGVKAGAVQVQFNGLDGPTFPATPDFKKSLSIDHARDGEVIVAYLMNGEQMPLLNGFPLRLIVPGWYSTYWVKMLSHIEVLDRPDDNFWMKTAYRIPDTPGANVSPTETGYKTTPINRMLPRSFVTNLKTGDNVKAGATIDVRGIAFGGDCGVKNVGLSTDGGVTWITTKLGVNEGKYSFRGWRARVGVPASGVLTLSVRCTNTQGETQSWTPNWNPGGYMRNSIETTVLNIV